MIIERTIEQRLREQSKQYPVVAVTGPRQSGKTTLVTTTFPDRPYVSLEDPDRRALALADPRGFLESLDSDVIIDEIQRVPDLLSYMQTLVDREKRPGQFIITGSNQFLLMKHVSQSLAGRISILKLLPFTVSELGTLLPSSAAEYMYTGSYPRIHDESLAPSDWYLNYIETYIEKDLKDFIRVLDLDHFRKFLSVIASMCGQLLNLSQIGNMLGLSHNTVKAWITALEQSYIVFRLQPYHRNFRKTIVKTPKLYFYDTGLACALLRLRDPKALETHHFYGPLFENLIIADLYKSSLHKLGIADFYFWRDHRGREIDCLSAKNGHIHPLEIKASKTLNTDFFKGLAHFCELAEISPKDATLVYGGDLKTTHLHMHAMNWQQFLVAQ